MFHFYFRSSCLQRYLWEMCGCLDDKLLKPYVIPSISCGYIENVNDLTFQNASHCLKIENIMNLPECAFIRKMMDDLACLHRFRTIYRTYKGKLMNCNCPEACNSFEFTTDYSTASWPTNGPQLDAAYNEIVKQQLIQKLKKQNALRKPHTRLTRKVIDYFSDESKKREIMSNFVRVTVYIKDLTVETIEDVAGYTEVDLISDIGKIIDHILLCQSYHPIPGLCPHVHAL